MDNQETHPFVDVIVVLWHSAPYTAALFNGLALLDYPKDRMAVHFVDNCPGDGSLDEVRRQQARFSNQPGQLPLIHIHEPGRNTGFSGGNNLAIRKSIEQGHKYSYLLNPDAEFESDALREAVAVAEQDENIGSVQSLLVLQQFPGEVNSSGNAIHYLGFGYCAGYHDKRVDIGLDTRAIAYGSGAGILYRNSVLKEVGLLDETLFAYHEDLDLGWRIMLAGYRNVLAPKSVVRHRYEFSRSISKWFWMERNRTAVVLKNYRLSTILLLSPLLAATEIAILAFAVKGGWWREKLRAMVWFLKPATWSYISRGRKHIDRIRKVPDILMLQIFTPHIAYQEFENDIVKKVANPLWKLNYQILKKVIKW
ncbi:MAG: glycosyltransferase family 2 protein [Patescibacteria group bacterium]